MSINKRYQNLSEVAAIINGGSFDEIVGRKINEAISAVESTQKGAEITIKLKIGLAAKNSDMVKIDPEVSVKMPKDDVISSIHYAKNGVLSNEKPRENPLPSNVEKIDSKRAN